MSQVPDECGPSEGKGVPGVVGDAVDFTYGRGAGYALLCLGAASALPQRFSAVREWCECECATGKGYRCRGDACDRFHRFRGEGER
jgi:hypothetical protein